MAVITLLDIARRIGEQLRIDAAQAERVVKSAVDIIRAEAAKGNRVEVGNLQEIFGAQGPAQPGGMDLDIPMPDIEIISPAARAAPGAQAQAPVREMSMEETLAALRGEIEGKDKLAGLDSYTVAMVVPKRDFFTDLVAARLGGARGRTLIIESSPQVFSEIRSANPDIVVVDATIPGYGELLLDIRAQKETSLIAVVGIYPEGSDPEAVVGMKVCENETIVEPFEVEELIGIAHEELSRTKSERRFFKHEAHFQAQTVEEWIEKANDLVIRLLSQAGFSAEEDAAALSVAFREAVDNCARHGNKNQANKLVDVIYLLDQEKATVTVEDEGEGFDTELYLQRGIDGNPIAAARERNVTGRGGGLGIMLMIKCTDDLEYNYAGNMIRLTKRIK